MKKIAIVNYNAPQDDIVTVPYLWLSLKAHYDDNYAGEERYEWLTPIYSPYGKDPQELADRIICQSPDILGISCYAWNDKLTYEVAAIVKKQLPNILIVGGGPAMYYENDKAWFKKHDFLDIICEYTGYGEVFFTSLLENLDNYSRIPFAIYPNESRDDWSSSNIAFNRRLFVWPNIIHNNLEFLSSFKRANVGKEIKMILETARGCPYKCVFCEWGGGTSTKVNFKDSEQVINDITLMFEILQPNHIDIIDANFGIIYDNVEHIQHVLDLNEAHGKCVKSLNIYGPTKVNKRNLKLIYEMLVVADLVDILKLSIQSTTQIVLDNIKRVDMPYDEQLNLYNDMCAKYGVKLRFETILGLPGETKKSFYSMLSEITRGDLIDPLIHNWLVLPSSPAFKSKSYVEQMKLVTKTIRYWHEDTTQNKVIYDAEYLSRTSKSNDNLLLNYNHISPFDIVISTYSYSVDDWVEMYMMKHAVTFLNTVKVITPIEKFIRHKMHINMCDYYESFFNDFLIKNKFIANAKNFLINELQKEEADIQYVKIVNNLPYFSHGALIRFIILMNPIGFFNDYYNWIVSRYGENEQLKDLINCTSSLIKTPATYVAGTEKQIRCKYDWVTWVGNFKYDDDVTPLNGYFLVNEKTHNGNIIDWNFQVDPKNAIRNVIMMSSSVDDMSMFFTNIDTRHY